MKGEKEGSGQFNNWVRGKAIFAAVSGGASQRAAPMKYSERLGCLAGLSQALPASQPSQPFFPSPFARHSQYTAKHPRGRGRLCLPAPAAELAQQKEGESQPTGRKVALWLLRQLIVNALQGLTIFQAEGEGTLSSDQGARGIRLSKGNSWHYAVGGSSSSSFIPLPRLPHCARKRKQVNGQRWIIQVFPFEQRGCGVNSPGANPQLSH